MSRRTKRLLISNELPISKWEWMALFRKLPDDAKVIHSYSEYNPNQLVLIVESSEYPVVPEGEMCPDLIPVLTFHDVDREKAPPVPPPMIGIDYGRMEHRVVAACICDMAYTGLRYHKSNCPMR